MNFLTAEWRKLMMANYVVSPEILQRYVPAGTELDLWNGKCYISLVGFMFLNTKVMGYEIPFHRDFAEVNLRFYVRRNGPDGWRRGVVFIQEIVPKPAIAWVANKVYGEKYVTHRMRHQWDLNNLGNTFTYEWKPWFRMGKWYKMSAQTKPVPRPIPVGSEAEFITEHYWGYAQVGIQSTHEYQVEHPRWDAYEVESYQIEGDFTRLYGQNLGEQLLRAPDSVFVAEGSPIAVLQKNVL